MQSSQSLPTAVEAVKAAFNIFESEEAAQQAIFATCLDVGTKAGGGMFELMTLLGRMGYIRAYNKFFSTIPAPMLESFLGGEVGYLARRQLLSYANEIEEKLSTTKQMLQPLLSPEKRAANMRRIAVAINKIVQSHPQLANPKPEKILVSINSVLTDIATKDNDTGLMILVAHLCRILKNTAFGSLVPQIVLMLYFREMHLNEELSQQQKIIFEARFFGGTLYDEEKILEHIEKFFNESIRNASYDDKFANLGRLFIQLQRPVEFSLLVDLFPKNKELVQDHIGKINTVCRYNPAHLTELLASSAEVLKKRIQAELPDLGIRSDSEIKLLIDAVQREFENLNSPPYNMVKLLKAVKALDLRHPIAGLRIAELYLIEACRILYCTPRIHEGTVMYPAVESESEQKQQAEAKAFLTPEEIVKNLDALRKQEPDNYDHEKEMIVQLNRVISKSGIEEQKKLHQSVIDIVDTIFKKDEQYKQLTREERKDLHAVKESSRAGLACVSKLSFLHTTASSQGSAVATSAVQKNSLRK